MTRLYVSIGLLVTLAVGCRTSDDASTMTKEEQRKLVAAYEKKKRELAARASGKAVQPRLKPPEPASSVTVSDDSAAPPSAEQEPPAKIPERVSDDASPWLMDEAVSIAPAAPLTATDHGVVLYDRTNDLHLARLGGLSRRNRSMKTPVSRPPGARRRFPLGRGPAVLGEYAYWSSEGKLLRRKVPLRGEAGQLEVLATDAQTGTRVAVVQGISKDGDQGEHPIVAYITRPTKEDGPLRAKVWVDGKTQLLTPEGNSTHSVSLVRVGHDALALSVQARMAMTPVHARRVELHGSTPRLGKDIVAWVGGGVQPLTEMPALAHGKNLWGFIPHERSITEFGLAILSFGIEPNMNTPTSWILYPNGIDPAPVTVGSLCGTPAVLYAQPKNAEPDAQQELILRSLGDDSTTQAVGSAKAYFSVSMAEAKGGALLAFVADWVSWAMTIRCRSFVHK